MLWCGAVSTSLVVNNASAGSGGVSDQGSGVVGDYGSGSGCIGVGGGCDGMNRRDQED